MRKVRLLRRPDRSFRPLGREELEDRSARGEVWETMIYFRHRCDDRWYEDLIDGCGFSGKRITPKRLRKLLLEALERRREASE